MSPPLFGPCLLWPRSPISATAERLFDYGCTLRGYVFSVVFEAPCAKVVHATSIGGFLVSFLVDRFF